MPDTILKRWNGSTFEELYPKTTVTQISASGTPSSTTFLRGDGQWATVSGSGTVTNVTAGTQISGMSMTITNGTTTPSIATSVSNAASFRTAIGAGTGDVVGPASSTTGNVPQFDNTTGKLLNGGKAINDSTSATAISTTANLVTERDIYYGLPNINNSHAYNSSTSIFAPTTAPATSYFLASGGTNAAPVWRFLDSDWEQADQSLTASTNVLSIVIPGAGTYKVFMSGAYYSTSTSIGVQMKFTYSGTLSTTPDSLFNWTAAQTAAATSGALHLETAMNVALTTTSVSATNTNHGMQAYGQFTTTNGGTFSLNIAPETGSTSVGVAEGTLLQVEQVI
jgi:hypothetical protein